MKQLQSLLLLVLSLMVISCSTSGDDSLDLKRYWMLESVVYPDGYTSEYPQNNVYWMRIYDDSCFFQSQVVKAPNGTIIVPSWGDSYTLIDKGNHEYLYLQGDGEHPLVVEDDSTIVIQENGGKYKWKVCDDLDGEKMSNIINVIRNDVSGENGYSNRYVISYAEQELKTTNHTLIFILVFIVMAMLLIINYARTLRMNKKRVEQELRQIQQEHQAMPEPVRKAMNTVEDEFHGSDFYLSLRKKISNGDGLSKDDWNEIEERFKSVYPRFSSTLLTLHEMSQVEYQVCLLLKLNVTPKEIADVLYKDKSSISSIRSRLYQKVFGKKGTSKEWDEFILSL